METLENPKPGLHVRVPSLLGRLLSYDELRMVQAALVQVRDEGSSSDDKNAAIGFLGGFFGVYRYGREG